MFVASSPVEKQAKPAWADPRSAIWALLLLVSLVAVYSPALRGSLLWDDDAHVTRPELRSVHGLWRVWFDVGATQQYYPLLHSAFWVEHRFWGDSVLGYHLATLGFHWLAACVLARLLRRLSFPAPWLAAFLFALHPVCVESVAWISEQKNTLSALFYLLAALVYVAFDEQRKGRLYALASFLFALALLTKTVTATLPAALLLLLWWRRGSLSWRRDIAPLTPWFIVGVSAGLFTAWAEKTYIGAVGRDFALSFLERVVLCGRVLCFYLKSLLWPTEVMFIYPRWDPGSHLAVQSLALAGIVALTGILALIARHSRGPLAGFLFFAGTLFPALGFFNVYPFVFSFVADHFQYLASLGILTPAAWGLHRLCLGVRPAAVRIVLLAAVPTALGILSHSAAQDYRDADSLNRATIAKNPDAWLAHYNLAVSLGRTPGGLDEAIAEYRQTLHLNPSHWSAESNLASALLAKPGFLHEAIEHYESALRLNPDFAEGHNDLALALAAEPGHLEEAISHAQRAIALKPQYDVAYNTLGDLLLGSAGRRSDAIAAYEKAVALKPDDPLYHYNLANALTGSESTLAKAIGEYREAIRLKPDYMEAHANLGIVLARSAASLPEGIAELREAERISPSSQPIHVSLAHALARSPARLAEAADEFERALKLDPNDVQTRFTYAVLLSSMPGRLADAKAQVVEVIRRVPEFAEAHFCLGVVELKLHQPRTDAIAELSRAVQLKPSLAAAQRLLRQLQSAQP